MLSKEKKLLFITGATGFVGTHLCRDLLKKESNIEIYALCRNTKRLSLDLLEHPRLHPIEGDLGSVKEDFFKALPEFQAVIHTAGLVHSFSNQEFFDVNTEGTRKLTWALSQQYKQKPLHVILISSLAAAGPHGAGAPVSAYGRSKLEAEKVFLDLKDPLWSGCIIRPPMVIGPEDPAMKDVFQMVLNGPIIYEGINGLEKKYSFVCVFDLVAQIAAASGAGLNSASLTSKFEERFYASHPKVITMGQLLEGIDTTLRAINPDYNKKYFNKTIHQRGRRVPFPLMKAAAFLLSKTHKLISKISSVTVRLTPDKIHEIKAEAWVCDGGPLAQHTKQDYQWDLEKTLTITAQNYYTP